MGKDYIYAVTPLLEDALMDRDRVHRQTACTAVKHMALGVVGFGNEDALIHLLNLVWPNVFEACCGAFLRRVRTRPCRPHRTQSTRVWRRFRRSARRWGRRRCCTMRCRDCSTRRAKCETCTGRCTTRCTSARRCAVPAGHRAVTLAQDALVAAYPKLPNEGKNDYFRHELYYFL